jgi:hypothetical protein
VCSSDLFEYGLRLSLRDLGLDRSDSGAALRSLARADTSQLVELFWSENEVNGDFVAAVERCPNLEVLGVRGCFSSDQALLAQFGRAVASLPKLEWLLMSSESAHPAGPSISAFLAEIEGSTIAHLDITGHQIEQFGIEKLIEFVQKSRSIKTVAADRSGVRRVATFEDLIGLAGAKGVVVAFPDEDLREAGRDRARLKRMCYNVAAGRDVNDETDIDGFAFPVFECAREAYPEFSTADILDQRVEKQKVAIESDPGDRRRKGRKRDDSESPDDGRRRSRSLRDRQRESSSEDDRPVMSRRSKLCIKTQSMQSESSSEAQAPRPRLRGQRRLLDSDEDEKPRPRRAAPEPVKSRRLASDSDEDRRAPKTGRIGQEGPARSKKTGKFDTWTSARDETAPKRKASKHSSDESESDREKAPKGDDPRARKLEATWTTKQPVFSYENVEWSSEDRYDGGKCTDMAEIWGDSEEEVPRRRSKDKSRDRTRETPRKAGRRVRGSRDRSDEDY